jgi:hypothetical protein
MLTLAASGCGGAPTPKEPSPATPLDERKAADVIARVLFNAQLEPERGRVVELGPGKQVSLEVAARGKGYGVAYLTAGEEAQLTVFVPQGAAGSDTLAIVPGTAGEQVLFLFERNYMLQEETNGDATVMSSAAAERRMEGEVRSFLRKAQAEGWK